MDTGPPPYNSSLVYGDEIDLVQLCAGLWAKRVLIALIILGFFTCGVGYAFLAPEIYRAEVRLLPPSQSSLSELTVGSVPLEKIFGSAGLGAGGEPGKYTTSPEKSAFDLTANYLKSSEVKRKLLKSPVFERYSGGGLSRKESGFKMSVSLPNKKNNRKDVVVSIEWNQSDEAAELVNTWVDLAMQGARDELVENARVTLQEKIKAVDHQIEAKKQQSLLQIGIELQQLREAKMVADSLSLIEPVDLSAQYFVSDASHAVNVMELRSLYLLGSKSLSAEIDALKLRREEKQSYSPSLVALEEKRNKLQQVKLDPYGVKTAKVDLRAVPPSASFKPKRKLIMCVSLVLGVMAGLLVGLIVVSLDTRKANMKLA